MLDNREWDLIRRLAVLDDPIHPFIGDDCAEMPQHGLLVTTDHMAEGVHFDLSFMPPDSVGWRLMAANASDVIAMGSRPTHCTINLAFPMDRKEEGEKIIEGIVRFCRKYSIGCIGGDTTGAPSFFVGATMFAPFPKYPWRRSGAKPGDRVFIAGEPGLSRAGLTALRRRRNDAPAAVERFLYPDPFVFFPPPVKLSAAIDVSDSLVSELTLIARASRVSIEIMVEKIPVHAEVALISQEEGIPVYNFLLASGEEFFLVVTSRDLVPGWYEIGIVTERSNHDVMVRADSGCLDLARLPVWDHFSR